MKNHSPSGKLPKTCVVIVAAGRGQRLENLDDNDSSPKQYRKLDQRSVLAHTLAPFLNHRAVAAVVVVIHRDDVALYNKATEHLSPMQRDKLRDPVFGGTTRQVSVSCGLDSCKNCEFDTVLIHDAARPFADNDLISAVLAGVGPNSGSVPALAVADTLKRAAVDRSIAENVDRTALFSAQTPQGFPFLPLYQAHQRAADLQNHDFTDDAALAQHFGLNSILVNGSADNFKITTDHDLRKAREMTSLPVPDVRVGHGYDTHQLVDGTSIWLCGLELPHHQSLSGHSDADVGLHALTDALLAAIADGDIGSHFPPSDPKWKGARSDTFLKFSADRVRSKGGTITHIDVTLICEQPKIGPHRDAMRERIGEIATIDPSRISVKATTNEKIGFIGREEGIVALATATVVFK